MNPNNSKFHVYISYCVGDDCIDSSSKLQMIPRIGEKVCLTHNHMGGDRKFYIVKDVKWFPNLFYVNVYLEDVPEIKVI